MKVKTRLILILSILIISILGSGALSVSTIAQSVKQSSELQGKMELQEQTKQLEFLLSGLSNDERGYLLNGEQDYVDGMKEKIQNIQATLTTIQQSPYGQDYVASVQKLNDTLTQAIAMNEKMVALRAQDEQAATSLHFGEERTLRKEVLTPAVDTLVNTLANDVSQLKTHNDQQAKMSNLILLIVTIAASVVGIILGIILLRSILKPLNLLNKQMMDIAEGEADLTQQIDIKQKDEFGILAGSFNKFVASLRDIVSQIGASSEMVAASAEEFSASAGQSKATSQQVAESMQVIADQAGRQTRELDRTSETLQNSLDKLSTISVNATDMADFSNMMRQQAEEGSHSIRQVGDQMHSIHQSVDQADQSVSVLATHASQIDAMTTLINEVSAQTNLLALNAAIEAARAGEHGKGFAVVADEVRKLAEQSAAATQQIKDLVTRIQTETQSTLGAIKTVKADVAAGSEVTRSTVEQFTRILQAVEDISGKTSEIAQHTVQMNHDFTESSHAMNQVNQGTRDISGSTQEIAAATEEQLASSEEIMYSAASLTDLAEELQVLVHRFKV
ncbi:methyl-accepting chemotaxis protein [Paenibacillus shenyangensis]|uniref:methyl-accepting chemotaxis protein n=1 Tax=Paenibacillus sp. A9 TaxID=1284352 RepID=UPI0003750761|nr:methyl-accepting chemotaxis protein [Paenibacillus sp. A9]